jgi:hypothetical protein
VELERQGTPAGSMRERERRQLFINGATAREAAEQAQVHYHNARPMFERMLWEPCVAVNRAAQLTSVLAEPCIVNGRIHAVTPHSCERPEEA